MEKKVSIYYNTPGVVNVALWLESRLKGVEYGEELRLLVGDVLKGLADLIKSVQESGDEENKKWHLRNYLRLQRSMQKLFKTSQ